MSWQHVVAEWRLRFNVGRPAAEAMTPKEARTEADRLIAMLKREARDQGRVVVPELGTFAVKKVKAGWRIGFRAGAKARGKT